MEKKTYEHTSGVKFCYEVDENGSIRGTVTISRQAMATRMVVLLPHEALEAFALVRRYEGWALHGEAEGKPCLTPIHPRWAEFVALLTGTEGIDLRKDEQGHYHHACAGHGLPLTRAILEKYFPEVGVEDTIDFFGMNGGHCDCEVLMKVDTAWQRVHDMTIAMEWRAAGERVHRELAARENDPNTRH